MVKEVQNSAEVFIFGRERNIKGSRGGYGCHEEVIIGMDISENNGLNKIPVCLSGASMCPAFVLRVLH